MKTPFAINLWQSKTIAASARFWWPSCDHSAGGSLRKVSRSRSGHLREVHTINTASILVFHCVWRAAGFWWFLGGQWQHIQTLGSHSDVKLSFVGNQNSPSLCSCCIDHPLKTSRIGNKSDIHIIHNSNFTRACFMMFLVSYSVHGVHLRSSEHSIQI